MPGVEYSHTLAQAGNWMAENLVKGDLETVVGTRMSQETALTTDNTRSTPDYTSNVPRVFGEIVTSFIYLW